MNEMLIEARAHYLIEDRVNPTRRTPSTTRRRHHRFPKMRWL